MAHLTSSVATAGELLKLAQSPDATPAQFRDVAKRLGPGAAELKQIKDQMGRGLLHSASQVWGWRFAALSAVLAAVGLAKCAGRH